jgi:Zn ribbon nucleic-acid-binding protein
MTDSNRAAAERVCPHCNGTGKLQWEHNSVGCGDCNSTGSLTDEPAALVGAEDFARQCIQAANDGYHGRDDYPAYAPTPWDDRLRWSDYLQKIIAERFAAAPRHGGEGLREWALEKASTHHRLAHENPGLRTEHIASSTAYRNLADEIAALSNAGEDAR